MKIARLARLLPVGFLLLIGSVAQAHTTVYTASLSGPAEFPANSSPGIGFATVTVDLDLVTMRVQANFSGLTGNVTNAHIHGATTVAGEGTAGVITTTPTFPGFPAGATFGTYDNTFNLGLSSSYNAAFITANGGTVSSAMNAFIAGLDAGKTYFNIHTSTFGGGEIRGFLTAIPEPSTYALVGGLVVGAVVVYRRRRK